MSLALFVLGLCSKTVTSNAAGSAAARALVAQ